MKYIAQIGDDYTTSGSMTFENLNRDSEPVGGPETISIKVDIRAYLGDDGRIHVVLVGASDSTEYSTHETGQIEIRKLDFEVMV